MKKIIATLLILNLALALVGCGQTDKQNVKSEQSKKVEERKEEKKETQEDINNKVKVEAVKADFVKVNAGEMNNKSVFTEGQVSSINKDQVMPTFTLTVKGENGYGMYSILCIDKEYIKNINNGDNVKVYGKVDGKDSTGMPKITGNIIEKLK